MKQHEAVIKVMEDNGGYATLGYLNQKVLQIENCEWKTRTPFASIRRIVQDVRFFFKIRPGLWALNSSKEMLPPDIFPSSTIPVVQQQEYSHSYYQGLLVELGNFRNYQTYIPMQDKNKKYLTKKLSDVATVAEVYDFSYSNFVKKVRTIDVVWFNNRNMPATLMEVEHSTDIYNSLLKFLELQDFNTGFYIVADNARKKEYEQKIRSPAFVSINKRIQFWDYEYVAELHAKTSALATLESNRF
ncbi:MAG: hypothetical protein WCJ56_00075 [bacterium]